MSAALGGRMSFELTAFIASLIVSNLSPVSREVEPDKVVIVPVRRIRGRALTRAEIESIIGKIVRERGIPASPEEIEKLAEDIYEWQGYLIEWRKLLKDLLKIEDEYSRGRLTLEKYLSSLLEHQKELEERIAGYVYGEENVKTFCSARFKTSIPEKEVFPSLEELLGRVVTRNIIGSGTPLIETIGKSVSKIVIEEGVKWLKTGEKLEGMTVIFEDPSCLVLEEKEGILYLRKATPEELKHRVQLKTAKMLMSTFLNRLEAEVKNWMFKPSTKWNIKIKQEYKEECREIPAVTYFLASLEEPKFIFSRKLLEVHVFLLVDADSLCRYGQTFKPYSLSEVGDLIEEFERKADEKKYPIILCLASLTGWLREDVDNVEKYENPGLQLYLVDVKNMKIYYNREAERIEFVEILNSCLK